MIEKISNRRETYRNQIRQTQIKHAMREKRAALLQAVQAQSLRSYQSQCQSSIANSLQTSDSLDKILQLLPELQLNRVRQIATLQLLQKIAYKLISLTDPTRALTALTYIKLIVFEYLSLPDQVIKPSLPIIYKFIKSKYFFDLFVNLSLIKNWGESEKEKQKFVEVYLLQVEERQLPTGQDIDIMENWLTAGEISSVHCYRFVNMINWGLGLKLDQRLEQKQICSLVNCVGLLAQSSRSQANNICNCCYILPSFEQQLKNRNLAKVLCGVMRSMNKMLWDGALVERLIQNHPTLLPNIAGQLSKTHKQLLTVTCLLLSNFAAFEEGTTAILQFGIHKKVLIVYESTVNAAVKIQAGYVIINILIRANRSYLLDVLSDGLEEVLLDILRDGYEMTWVRPELVVLAVDEVGRMVTEGEDLQRRLSQRRAMQFIEAMLHSNNTKISEASNRFISSLRMQSDYE